MLCCSDGWRRTVIRKHNAGLLLLVVRMNEPTNVSVNEPSLATDRHWTTRALYVYTVAVNLCQTDVYSRPSCSPRSPTQLLSVRSTGSAAIRTAVHRGALLRRTRRHQHPQQQRRQLPHYAYGTVLRPKCGAVFLKEVY